MTLCVGSVASVVSLGIRSLFLNQLAGLISPHAYMSPNEALRSRFVVAAAARAPGLQGSKLCVAWSVACKLNLHNVHSSKSGKFIFKTGGNVQRAGSVFLVEPVCSGVTWCALRVLFGVCMKEQDFPATHLRPLYSSLGFCKVLGL